MAAKGQFTAVCGLALLLAAWAGAQPFDAALVDALADAVVQRLSAAQQPAQPPNEQPQHRHARFASLHTTMHASLSQLAGAIERLLCESLPLAFIAATIFTIFLIGSLVVPYFLSRLLRLIRTPYHIIDASSFAIMIGGVLIGFYVALDAVGIDVGAIFLGIGLVGFAVTTALGGPLSQIGAGFGVRADPNLAPGHEISVAGLRGIVHSHNFLSVTIDTTSELVGSDQPLTDDERAAIEKRRAARYDSVVVPNTHFSSQGYTLHVYHAAFVPRQLLKSRGHYTSGAALPHGAFGARSTHLGVDVNEKQS